MGARADETELRGRVTDLRAALEVAGERVSAPVRTAASDALTTAEGRLDLGVEHTVVALVGGTGSGKSSLFNAISRMTFADVGVRRPTTSLMTACAWSERADALLDWVGVDRERRINRFSSLDGDQETQLKGLVLLDLPDHDSVATVHRETVDRVVPMADLVVWVVDPQKYADHALHAGYLQGMAGVEGSMLVVLNQLDTVPESQRDEILADVQNLLTVDGLGEVEVLGASAVTGDGVPEIRARLATIVAQRSRAALRVATELSRAAEQLTEVLPAEVARRSAPGVAATVDALADLVGLPERTTTAAHTLDDGTRAGADGALTAASVTPLREAWLTVAGAHLGPAWRDSLVAATPGDDDVAARVTAAVRAVRLPAGPSRAVRAWRATAGVGLVVGLAGLVAWLVLQLMDAATDDVRLLLLGVGALGAVLGLAALLAWRGARRAQARARSEAFASSVRDGLGRVVHELFEEPADVVLGEHAEARTLALAAVSRERARHARVAETA
ncbi:GTP-binding protein [Sanguibacter sp. HDW7]|uniref:GTP-binding protein n=1 Tax=Sanguibacter sp. HDW7 TaxID=2714931 RepID=UPI00140B2E59|nr:GTP-binding protein [Sanguibacter sp. HDW7]QIK83141.1 ABC transporter [Sanguibacter sp. HDW7]